MILAESDRILHCHLKLRPNTLVSDTDNLYALKNAARHHTHVFLSVPSWQEKPDAAFHRSVTLAVHILKDLGLPFIWARWHWAGWFDAFENPHIPTPSANCYLDPEYHTTSLQNIHIEAAFLEAIGTGLDAEPNGRPVCEPNLQAGFTESQLADVLDAVDAALRVVQPVDLLYPCESGSAKHSLWAFLKLGEEGLGHKSFYSHSESGPPNVKPPDSVETLPNVWGSFVTPASEQIGTSKQWTLSPTDCMALRVKGPQWTYIRYEQYAETLRIWRNL